MKRRIAMVRYKSFNRIKDEFFHLYFSVIICLVENVIHIEDHDDEVIFVGRTQNPTMVIDLCDTPDREINSRKRKISDSTKKDQVADQSLDETNVASGPKFRCPICLERIDADMRPYSTMCGHIFCQPCITNCIKIKKKCPLCNTKLTPKGIHPLYFTN